jgi:hypothetical protein
VPSRGIIVDRLKDRIARQPQNASRALPFHKNNGDHGPDETAALWNIVAVEELRTGTFQQPEEIPCALP